MDFFFVSRFSLCVCVCVCVPGAFALRDWKNWTFRSELHRWERIREGEERSIFLLFCPSCLLFLTRKKIYARIEEGNALEVLMRKRAREREAMNGNWTRIIFSILFQSGKRKRRKALWLDSVLQRRRQLHQPYIRALILPPRGANTCADISGRDMNLEKEF